MAEAVVGALRAILSADIAQFTKAMADAGQDVKKLADKLAQDLEPRQKAVNAAVRQFLGQDDIRRALEYADAVGKIGGANLLTETDQLRVNKAVSEALAHYKALGIDAPKTLTDLQHATAGAVVPTESLNVSFGKLVASYVTAQAVMGLAKEGFALVTGAITESIKAAGDAEKAHVQVVAALRAQGMAVPSVVEAYGQYAAALQRTTVFQDDAIEGAEALLVQIGNVMPRDMEKALQATTNLASGLGIDLDAAVRLVAKSAEGNTAALKKVGVVLDESGGKGKDFASVLDAINEKFGGQAEAVAGTYQGRIAQLGNTWNNVQESVGRAITENQTLLDALNAVTQEIDHNTGELRTNQQVNNLVSDAVLISIRAFSTLAATLDVVQTGGSAFMITLRNLGGALGNIGIAALEAGRALLWIQGNTTGVSSADQQIKALREAVDELGKRNEATTARSVALGMALDEISRKADQLAKDLEKTRGKTVEIKDATDTSTDAWTRHTKAVESEAEANKKAAEALKAFKAEMDFQESVWADEVAAQKRATEESNRVMEAFFADLKRQDEQAADLATMTWQDVIDAHKRAVTKAEAEMEIFFGKQHSGWLGVGESARTVNLLFSALGQTATGAMRQVDAAISTATNLTMTYAKAVDAARQANDAQKVAAQTSAAASALAWGSMTLGVSLLATAFASARANAKQLHEDIAKLKDEIAGLGETPLANTTNERGRAPGKDTKPYRDQLQQQLDDLTAAAEASQARMDRLGLTTDDLVDPLTRASKAAAQLGDDLNHIVVADIDGVASKISGPLMAALKFALDTGSALAPALKPFLESLIRGGKLTADLAAQLLGLPAPDVAPWEEMQSIAAEFGISVDKLGVKFQQSKLVDGAEDLAHKWDVLVTNGADLSAVIAGMSPRANDFLHNALKWGLEVPASMRPMLEAMQRAGALTDNAGNKLDSLDDVHWGRDLTKAIDDLITKLEELFTKMGQMPSGPWQGGSWPGGAPFIPPGSVTPPIQIPYASGSGGLQDFDPVGTPVLLHGREEVLTEAQSAGIASWVQQAIRDAGGNSRGGGGTAILQVNGRTIAEVVVPEIPGVVERYRLNR